MRANTLGKQNKHKNSNPLRGIFLWLSQAYRPHTPHECAERPVYNLIRCHVATIMRGGINDTEMPEIPV